MNAQTQNAGESPSRTVVENLQAGAETFRQRASQYGPSHIIFGGVMDQMFPQGLEIKPGDTFSYIRLGLFVQIVSKLTRYAESLAAGGHKDSAHDIMVYAAMLEHATDRPRNSDAKTIQ